MQAKKHCSMNIGGTDKTAAAAFDGQVSVQSKTKMLNRDYSFLFSNDDVDAADAAKHPHDDHVKILVMKRVDESKKENDQSTHVQYKQPDDHLEKAKEKELIIHQHKKPKLMPHDNHKVTMKTSQCDQKYPKGQPSKANSLGAKSQIKSSSSSSEMKKKKPNHEPVVDYSSVIRKVFRYDKTKYGRDYDDDRAMVSNFADIQREEKRSERLGKKEDEEERILTEEMERKEKKLKQSKRRKLQAHQKD
ncbi:hypothetical protein FNV43_RR22931 [Rhamnella rubrinervis]|uniref:Uncharacterized protein n=1 Tax=Rhamnella rubrinervis TaxID=2594499 RepID=A0A8K0DX33_9ROSA|nr:hypothetical protein FNV43_RR22931 [Rhamnella rubrinervis]